MKFLSLNRISEYYINFRYSVIDYDCTDEKIHLLNNRIIVCEISTKGKSIISAGDAICHEKDKFVKDKGRKISLAKALKNGHFTKGERKAAWKAYFERGNEDINIKIEKLGSGMESII